MSDLRAVPVIQQTTSVRLCILLEKSIRSHHSCTSLYAEQLVLPFKFIIDVDRSHAEVVLKVPHWLLF
jgi:hypothetical protein